MVPKNLKPYPYLNKINHYTIKMISTLEINPRY
nr:MAG TPA: hypothetical protein [Caudoviricetes sp.]DAV26440.1 MAG TPA: hypothetical protein [Caudoviricetes sp.]